MKARLIKKHTAPAAGLVALLLASCSQSPTSVPLRSLERSGELTLLCLDLASTGEVGYSLEDCQARRLATKAGGSGQEVRLYAMVTQTTRGEAVLLDIPAAAVVDTNATSPGYNFLQVGAQPVSIASTPEGTATFVASAEVNRPGIYALPSKKLLDRPGLTSWPACALPARPGAMTVLVAPNEGLCGGPNYAVDVLGEKTNPAHPGGDLGQEKQRPGARKLLVALPGEGELLLLDAQAILDRTPGSFDACPVERRYKLDSAAPGAVDLPGDPPADDVCPARPPSSSASFCPVRKPQTVTYPASYRSAPAGFAQLEGTLYIADKEAPLIHAYDFSDPCEPVKLPPLLPSSFDQPWRPVSTRKVAVSPTTGDGKRFLYAVDDLDGSAMIFDVTPGSGGRTPVVRSRPEYFPFSPRDRLNLGAPIQDITFVQQDFLPYDDQGTKISGVRCDPLAGSTSPGVQYRPNGDLSDGAGPTRLRGVFALAALTSGQVTVIDVDDYDAPCRRANPKTNDLWPDWVTGCDDVYACDSAGACSCTSISDSAEGASGELTCRAVVRHEIRSRNYIQDSASLGRHAPALAFPSLSADGASLSTDNDSNEEARQTPKMLGPKNDIPRPKGSAGAGGGAGSAGAAGAAGTAGAGGAAGDAGAAGEAGAGGATAQGSEIEGRWGSEEDVATGQVGDPTPRSATRNFVVPDIRDPRATVSQDWSAVYEGVIPGTAGKIGRLLMRETDPEKRGIFDPSGSFCYLGVHDVDLARLEGYRLYPEREQQAAREQFAQSHSDWAEITNDLLAEEDPYWGSVGDQCSYLRCRATFGTASAPTVNRSFRIRKNYHDRLLLGPDAPGPITVADPTRDGTSIDPECCFPTLTSYQIRGGSSWVVAGSASGFLHRTTLGEGGRCALLGVDPSSGEVCDPSFLVRTGRAYEVPSVLDKDTGVRARPISGRLRDDPFAFHNPYMHFFIYEGASPSRRGMAFTWQLRGGFEALEVSLGRGSSQVAPQSMLFHPALGTEVLITDGALQGVMSIDLFQLAVVRTFL